MRHESDVNNLTKRVLPCTRYQSSINIKFHTLQSVNSKKVLETFKWFMI